MGCFAYQWKNTESRNAGTQISDDEPVRGNESLTPAGQRAYNILRMQNVFRKTVRSDKRGFTILEVIAVILVLGVLTAVAVAKMLSPAPYLLATETETLKMHLRYAQFRALSDDVTWGVTFAGSSYTLQRNGATAPYNLPNEDSATHTLASGVSLTGTGVTFDRWGSPGDDDIVISLASGESSQAITVKKRTGFITP